MSSARTNTCIRRQQLTHASSRHFSYTRNAVKSFLLGCNTTYDEQSCKYDARRVNPEKPRRGPSGQNPAIAPACHARKSANALEFRGRRLRCSRQAYQFWDFENYLAEADDQDEIRAVYTNEPQPYGNLISQFRKGPTIWTPSYYQYDALGSTRALTDDAGDVTDTYIYDAWGNEVAVTGTTVNPFRWVGQVGYYHDEAAETFYIRARVYEPATGRWISEDPIGFAAGDMNLYRYVANSPLTYTDPTGLVICPEGNWSFVGKHSFGGMYWVGGVDSVWLRFTCDNANLTKKRIYRCCDGTELEEKYYSVAKAEGYSTSAKLGGGLGGSWSTIVGRVTGAPNTADLSGWSWTWIAVELSVVAGGYQGGIGGSGSFGGWSFGIGGEVGVTTQWAYVNAHWRPPETGWTGLNASKKRLMKQLDCQLGRVEQISPPESYPRNQL